MTELKRTGSNRAVVPASIRNGRRNRNVTAAIAGTAIVAFAAVGLAQPFLAAANGTAAIAPHTPSLAQISAAQTQSFQAEAAPVAKKDNKKSATVTLARGGDVEADLKPEPKPAPVASESSASTENADGAPAEAPAAPAISYDPGSLQGQAQAILAEKGQSDQWGCFDYIISNESGWNPNAENPSSGTYGLGQSMDQQNNPQYRNDPIFQINWALDYMNGRYGSPCGAKAFWDSNHWY